MFKERESLVWKKEVALFFPILRNKTEQKKQSIVVHKDF